MKKVIKFHAAWCGPCRMYAPAFDRVASNHSDIAFQSVDIDENPQFAEEYGVRGVPTTVMIKDGKEVDRVGGALSTAKLEKALTALD
jgi:thioredoxin